MLSRRSWRQNWRRREVRKVATGRRECRSGPIDGNASTDELGVDFDFRREDHSERQRHDLYTDESSESHYRVHAKQD